MIQITPHMRIQVAVDQPVDVAQVVAVHPLQRGHAKLGVASDLLVVRRHVARGAVAQRARLYGFGASTHGVLA